MTYDFDWLVIGSGFGGSVCALRLAEKGYRVGVLEQGRRFADGDFARTAWDLRSLLWAPRLGLRGILRVAPYRHATVITGVGVGGGSLVYANTLYQPRGDAFYRHPQWADLADWRSRLDPHYRTAQRMLGVTQYVGQGPSERLMRTMAADLGVPGGYRTTPVAVHFGEPGVTVPDPYFGGTGPDRTGCVRCGQCMLGCRYGAKNTLTKNYLWFAERAGAVVLPNRKAVDVRPLGTAPGYVVAVRRPGSPNPHREWLTAHGVIFAGGTIGTNELLRRCKDRGSLPGISDRLGTLVRTNDEAIPAVTAFGQDADLRADVAITSSIFLDEHTHVTNNTYGLGGDALGLTFGPLTDATGRWARRAQFLARLPRHLRRHRPRGWSRRSVIFTVMRDTEAALRLCAGRGPGRLQSERTGAEPADSVLAIANRITKLAANRVGGYPQSSVAESLFSAPTTAHFLGGAVIGADPDHGVIDHLHRVFGYQNLLVCDGAAVPANVGVNPSLTISALAEAAIAAIAPPR